MALHEKLDRFKKQQEKCQSTLADIAGPSKSTGAQKSIPAASTVTNTRTPGPPVKFSNDTERLQHINSIRKAPVGAQMKRVIGLLFESKHDLKDKNQLLSLICKFPEGIATIDLKDAYPAVTEDLQALKAAGKIWLLSNYDSQEDIAYPNDPRANIKVDDELKQLFRGVELAHDMLDIEKDLLKNGMKPATDTAKRRAAAQVQGISSKPKNKKKKHEISKRTKLTNAHLPELFRNLGS
ncbi:hypothetical protein JCGZ_17307 [Jatropha curcas]|uniref:TFA2 Winged helix domain-containing protein n=1 Tax=Jatropha curcas TaxID=180498 RepID=A0A067LLR9_JATCU|nr:hypothetical protein JCGZ_17307 [Jatropha curcas]